MSSMAEEAYLAKSSQSKSDSREKKESNFNLKSAYEVLSVLTE